MVSCRCLSTSACLTLALALIGCQPSEQPRVTSLIGGLLFDGAGGPPISDSVVTIENGYIRAAGLRASLPIPAEADKIDASGKFIVPDLIDVAKLAAAPGAVTIVHPGDPDSAYDAARRGHRPLLGEVSSLRDARAMVARGVTGFLHMIRDTAEIDPAFITQLRDLRIVFVPMLSEIRDSAELERARHNTRRLADGGVPMAAGSTGDLNRELESMAAAGLTPSELLTAATRNGAFVLGRLDQTGTIEPGKRASLLLLSANPAENVRNLRKVDRIMRDGQWVAR